MHARSDVGRPLPANDEEQEERPTATSAMVLVPLPLGGENFPEEVLAIVCRFLGPRELGRLACVSRRFTERTLTSAAQCESALLSPIEEGARLRLAAAAAVAGAEAAVFGSGGPATAKSRQPTWLRALWHTECRVQPVIASLTRVHTQSVTAATSTVAKRKLEDVSVLTVRNTVSVQLC